MKIIAIQNTPNPNAKKFILDQSAFEQPLSFFTAESARGYQLAERLFAIPGVATLLFLNDFITVNKSHSAKWADISKRVRKILGS